MRYMGTHPWYDLFCDFMMKGNNVNDNGLAIDLMCYECMCCIVLTCRVQGLCDSRVCDASMTQYIAWRRALLPNADTMTRTNKLDSSKVCFDRVYRPRMLRGMDVFHPMFYDTRGRGRAVLRHSPHVVVMTTVGCLLGEARSAIQPTLSLSGSYVVRSVKPTSTSILAEEG